jgi:hypothetical protein
MQPQESDGKSAVRVSTRRAASRVTMLTTGTAVAVPLTFALFDPNKLLKLLNTL